MKNFHFKTKDARTVETFKSIVEDFELTSICLKNITTTSFCSVDTNEKIFEIIIDVKIDIAEIDVTIEKIKDKIATINKSLKIVVDNFEKRSNFFFD